MENLNFLLTRSAFKAYDIRGRVPEELNEELAYRIGRACAEYLQAKKIVVGFDIRKSSESLATALALGINDAGTEVIDIGLCGTEMVYFATSHLKADGGIMITASHNPKEYNGMKIVRKESRPISGDSGLKEIEELAITGKFGRPAAERGKIQQADILKAYVQHLLSFIDVSVLKPLTIVTNAGNGCAGIVLNELEEHLPFKFIKVHNNPDGTFPHGVPNPILEENREATAKHVREMKADLGIAWDGDFDRCFLFDENGAFIEGYYMVGFLAENFLAKNNGAKIIHDPRLVWNTLEIAEKYNGIPVQSKTGHAFIKERMRKEDAIYGGEMSAHHYFKDFFYCDSGMIPWLLVVESLCRQDKTLSELVKERMEKFPVSGEINRTVENAAEVINKIEQQYATSAVKVDYTDGLSIEYDKWRFNVRMSNTEPVLRLNVETRGDKKLLTEKTAELLRVIGDGSC